MNRVKNTKSGNTSRGNANRGNTSRSNANRGNTSRGNANLSKKRPRSPNNSREHIKPLLYKPEYMHYAYLVRNVLSSFVMPLKSKAVPPVRPMHNRMLKVDSTKDDKMSFNFPSLHRNTTQFPFNSSQRGVIAQTIPSSRAKRNDPEARWRIIINPYKDREIQGPDILDTSVNARGYFGLRGHVELTRTTNDRTRIIEHFSNSDPNVNNRSRIIKTKLKPGDGIIFLNTTLHRPPPERRVGDIRRQVIYDTKWTPALMKLLNDHSKRPAPTTNRPPP